MAGVKDGALIAKLALPPIPSRDNLLVEHRELLVLDGQLPDPVKTTGPQVATAIATDGGTATATAAPPKAAADSDAEKKLEDLPVLAKYHLPRDWTEFELWGPIGAIVTVVLVNVSKTMKRSTYGPGYKLTFDPDKVPEPVPGAVGALTFRQPGESEVGPNESELPNDGEFETPEVEENPALPPPTVIGGASGTGVTTGVANNTTTSSSATPPAGSATEAPAKNFDTLEGLDDDKK